MNCNLHLKCATLRLGFLVGCRAEMMYLTKKKSDIDILPIQRINNSELENLLHFLPAIYPNSREWMSRKTDEINCGTTQALGLIASEFARSRIVGIAICSHKGLRSRKLSTFYVKPRYRRLGLGTALLNQVMDDVVNNGIDDTWVTTSHCESSVLGLFFRRAGFQCVAKRWERYLPDAFEYVYSWNRNCVNSCKYEAHLGE